ncbi:MAG: flavin oxidoreductase/NADH oxidase [Ruminococcaceae bacterium]|nr:flavin oxidoreductase/NADH oxidase [Oscillospiraceae bacterium]
MERKVYLTCEDFKSQNIELKTNLPFSEKIDILSEPKKVGNKIVPNRLVCQAMEGCDGTKEGSPDELTKRRYSRFAKGGAGMIWFEATAVLEEGRANPRQLYITENNLDDFKREVAEIKETSLKANGYEPIIVMQATHSGRYSKPQGVPAPLIAYNNPIFEKDNPISSDRIVTDDYLDRVGEALVKGATLAEKAGFDGVDIKCCHRYLNSELLSAFERDGRYGGSLENRTRLLRESVKGAIESCGKDFIVSSRLNVYDGFEYPYGFGVKKDGGLEFDTTEPLWLIKELYSYGVRLLNITMGNPYFNPHVNRPFAKGGYEVAEHPLEGVARVLEGTKKLKEMVPEMDIICSAVSFLGVAAPHVVASYIQDGKFDFAGFGRTIFAYPDFAKDIINNKEMDRKKVCICCSKCTEIMRTPGGTPGCVIRDKEVFMPIYKKQCGGEK